MHLRSYHQKNLDVVGQSVDQGDGARGVGKDGVPALEWQVGGDQQGAVLIAAADELEDQEPEFLARPESASIFDRKEQQIP